MGATVSNPSVLRAPAYTNDSHSALIMGALTADVTADLTRLKADMSAWLIDHGFMQQLAKAQILADLPWSFESSPPDARGEPRCQKVSLQPRLIAQPSLRFVA